MPSDAIRPVLKNNTRTYFQTHLPNHVFDYQVIYQAVPLGVPAQSKKGAPTSPQQRLVVAGARDQCINDLAAVGKAAGLSVPHIIPGVICPINAFELAHPEEFHKQIVALVEIGFKHSTICILQQGELVLNRVIQIGGNRMTAAIAENLNISCAEAEGIKVGMPNEVHSVLKTVVSNLSRELRASIDYFENQQGDPVSRVYVSGGPARSESVIELLCDELMMDCVTWNPTSFCNLTLSPAQSSEIGAVSHQLGVAMGAAIAAL
ncbi:MAG: pilus assembly protein PilM [Verrucomicrobiota bacterium]